MGYAPVQKNTWQDTKLSPAMCVFGHPIRDFIPIPSGRYSPHNKQGECLSEHTKRLPPLAIGDCVHIQNQIRHYPLKWDKTGVIIEVCQFDQYAVKVNGLGRVTLHNRKFLRKYVHVKSLKPTKTTGWPLVLECTCHINLWHQTSFKTNLGYI